MSHVFYDLLVYQNNTKKNNETSVKTLEFSEKITYVASKTKKKYWSESDCVAGEYYILQLNREIMSIELACHENLASSSMRHTEHWTAVSTLLCIFSSAYRDLHH